MDVMQRLTGAAQQLDFAAQAIPAEAKADHVGHAVRELIYAVQTLAEHSHAPLDPPEEVGLP